MPTFLQTREWAEIQERDGHAAHRFAFEEVSCIALTHRLPLGLSYYYVPRVDIGLTAAFWEAIRKFAMLTRAVFIRIESVREIVPPTGFYAHAVRAVQPQVTLVTDIARADEEILAGMHPKTRYNIRLAEKRGVEVMQQTGRDAENAFYDLLLRTSRRSNFRLHAQPHYANLLHSNSHEFRNELWFASVKGNVVAAAIVNFFEKTATYLHGASDYRFHDCMAPYLLHWQIMKKARADGMREYDWHGIDEVRWPGITRFKLGFGGRRIAFPLALDIVFRPAWYALYQAMRRALQ